MSKLKRKDFNLQKVKFTEPGLSAKWYEKVQVEGETETLDAGKSGRYNPHADLNEYKSQLKHYLAKAFHLTEGFDIAEKYLKGGQKQKAIDAKIELMRKIQITGISVGGTDELRGIVITGKISSFNESKSAMNTPRIVFSSDKLGFEKEVEKIFELIENEVYKYFFNGKSGERTLFNTPEVPSEESTEPKTEAA